MNNKPLVSIIIPTYKSSNTLKRAVISVLNQTYKNIEVIVVDDNNPDTEHRTKTEAVMKEFEKNSRVKYIKHERNKNGAAARNTGFRHSKGEYICFLDDDDVFLEKKVEKQVEFLQENGQFDGVYTWRYQHGNVISYDKSGDLSEEILSLAFTPYTSSIMIKRECYDFLNGFDESYKRHQDFEFLLRFFQHFSIGVIKEPLVEIKGNDVDNRLHGKEMELLKDQFLSQFEPFIQSIDQKKKGFKIHVYAMHYSDVFWDYLIRKEFKNAFQLFSKYTKICGLVFWKAIFSTFVKKVRIKIAMLLGKK